MNEIGLLNPHAKELRRVQERIVKIKCLMRGGSGTVHNNKNNKQTWCNYAVYFTIRALDENFDQFIMKGFPEPPWFGQSYNLYPKEYEWTNDFRKEYSSGLISSNFWCDVLNYKAHTDVTATIKEVDYIEAQIMANKGYVVIISWKNLIDIPKEAHPHFATVYPSGIVTNEISKIKIANVGWENGCDDFYLAKGFPHYNQVHFYYNSEQIFREDYNIGEKNAWYPSINELEKKER